MLKERKVIQEPKDSQDQQVILGLKEQKVIQVLRVT